MSVLQENGYFVLRFLAEDIGKRLDEVLSTIERTLVNRKKNKNLKLLSGSFVGSVARLQNWVVDVKKIFASNEFNDWIFDIKNCHTACCMPCAI